MSEINKERFLQVGLNTAHFLVEHCKTNIPEKVYPILKNLSRNVTVDSIIQIRDEAISFRDNPQNLHKTMQRSTALTIIEATEEFYQYLQAIDHQR